MIRSLRSIGSIEGPFSNRLQDEFRICMNVGTFSTLRVV